MRLPKIFLQFSGELWSGKTSTSPHNLSHDSHNNTELSTFMVISTDELEEDTRNEQENPISRILILTWRNINSGVSPKAFSSSNVSAKACYEEKNIGKTKRKEEEEESFSSEKLLWKHTKAFAADICSAHVKFILIRTHRWFTTWNYFREFSRDWLERLVVVQRWLRMEEPMDEVRQWAELDQRWLDSMDSMRLELELKSRSLVDLP